MALPILTLPYTKTELPVSKKKVSYRPYNVAEEKILTTAIASDDMETMSDAVAQIIENCTGLDCLQLHPADMEWIFIKLRSASMGNVVIVEMGVECGEECPKKLRTRVNLDTEVFLAGEDQLVEAGFIKKKNGWQVPVTDQIGFVFNVLTSKTDERDDVLFNSLVCVYEGENITERDQTTKAEFMEFFNSVPPFVRDKVDALIVAQPYLAINVKAKCPKCGTEHATELQGILDFFE